MANGDAVGVYQAAKQDLLEGTLNLASGGDTIKVALLAAYTPNLTTHTNWASVSATEVTNTSGYTAGGETLGSQAVSASGANAKFDGADVTWTGLQVVETPSHAIIYASVDDVLIGAWECTTVTNGGNYTLAFHANGIMVLS